jgi:acyl carrier protein
MESIQSIVRRHLADAVCLDDEGENLRLADRLFEDVGLDSLDLYDLITDMEDEHNIDLSDCDEKLSRRSTVQDLVDYVTEAMSEA